MELTVEQSIFINVALEGKNILVDACVGSGKTTAIQELCRVYPKDKRILYLTYNSLLKLDAKEKIKGRNVTVSNYHGYAYAMLARMGISAGKSDSIQLFLENKPKIGKFDLLVLDEYQDIDLEISRMLVYIKKANPGIQIVAVGDMMQKIYDKTTLNVEKFIDSFIGKRENIEFTKSFRLSPEYADGLANIWKKKIVGINTDCKAVIANKNQAINILATYEPKDILCLGMRRGIMSEVINYLERFYPNKYNKDTLYASIADNDRFGAVKPGKDTAIFTTFDGCKGMERKICIVFDFTVFHWLVRKSHPQQKYEILRNIFCVAASRGKKYIVFVEEKEALVREQVLSTPFQTRQDLKGAHISSMFDFKYKEDIEECFNLLDVKKVFREDSSVIELDKSDGLIDLTPCMGTYLMAHFFSKYSIDREFEFRRVFVKDMGYIPEEYKSLDEKILYLTSLETGQERYVDQVEGDIVNDCQKKEIERRLSSVFSKKDDAQKLCEIQFSKRKNGSFEFSAAGYADVIKDETVYELKFVGELSHEHFLQCACYMLGSGLKKGVLWNIRTNDMYEIRVPDEDAFLDCVTKTITKHHMRKYHRPKERYIWINESCL